MSITLILPTLLLKLPLLFVGGIFGKFSLIVSCSHFSLTHPFFIKFENDLNYDHALSCRCLGLCLVGNLRKCSAPSWVVDTQPRLVWTGPYLKDKFAKLEIN
jgi:hypothetical protein